MKEPKERYVNTTIASAVFAALLFIGFIFTAYHPSAPYAIFMEGLALGFGVVTGKRLFQTWKGKGKGFGENKP